MSEQESDDLDRAVYRLSRARRSGDVAVLRAAMAHIDQRRYAALYLGELGAVEAISDIRPLLDSEDRPERVNAARALGRLTDEQSVATLLRLVDSDPERQVRL